jgi:hypothetical protein
LKKEFSGKASTTLAAPEMWVPGASLDSELEKQNSTWLSFVFKPLQHQFQELLRTHVDVHESA